MSRVVGSSYSVAEAIENCLDDPTVRMEPAQFRAALN